MRFLVIGSIESTETAQADELYINTARFLVIGSIESTETRPPVLPAGGSALPIHRLD